MNLKVGDVYRNNYGNLVIIDKIFKHIIYATAYNPYGNASNSAVYLVNGSRVISLHCWSTARKNSKGVWIRMAKKRQTPESLAINFHSLISREVS